MKTTCSVADLAATPSFDNCVHFTEAAAAQIEADGIETLPVWHATARMAAVTAVGVIAAGLIAGLGGCANMSGIAPQSTLRDAASLALPESSSSAASPASVQAPTLAADWWREFGDAQLNALVAQALQSSLTLKLAQARLARAQAVTEVADAASLPELNGQLGVTRQRYTGNGAVPPPLASSIRSNAAARRELGARFFQ